MLAVSRTTAEYPLDGLLFGAFLLTTIVVARQLTALKDNVRLMEEFRRLASTDALTGLVSRRHFHDLAQQELVRSRQDGRPLATLMVDLDHFKEINDTYGHATGDDVLRWVANRIEVLAPATAIAGRYGGDELVIIVPASLDEALAFADELAAHTSAVAYPVAGGPDIVSLSIGVASAAGCADIETMLRCADSALYEAKHAGRNCARAHPELSESGDDEDEAVLQERRVRERRRASAPDS
jgi:diguanylate cyclase (GGDEF)-like protein